MHRLKKREIAIQINNAITACAQAFRAYKPSGGTLDHAAALRALVQAEMYIRKSAELILTQMQKEEEHTHGT